MFDEIEEEDGEEDNETKRISQTQFLKCFISDDSLVRTIVDEVRKLASSFWTIFSKLFLKFFFFSLWLFNSS